MAHLQSPPLALFFRIFIFKLVLKVLQRVVFSNFNLELKEQRYCFFNKLNLFMSVYLHLKTKSLH